LAPKGPLAQELVACSLEEELDASKDENLPIPIEDTWPLSIVKDKEDDDTPQEQPPYHPTLMTTRGIGDVSRDLGATTAHESTVAKGYLKTNRQFILQDIKDVIGTKKVNRRTLEFAPPWIVQ